MRNLLVVRLRYTFAFDMVCVALAYAASIVFRYEPGSHVWSQLARQQNLLWLSLGVRVPIYAAFGLYAHLWRYASTREFLSIILAGTLSSAVVALVNFALLPIFGIAHCESVSVVTLDWLFNLGLLSSTRIARRLFQERASTHERLVGKLFVPKPRNALVVGAGDAGSIIVREMLHNPSLGLSPVAFVDDDPLKKGLRVHNVPILGTRQEIPALAARLHVDEIVVAMPTAPGNVIRDVRRICKEAKLPCRTMPGMFELLDGKVSVSHLREVRIEDLLRRDPVITDQAGVRAYVQDQTVLVTGAGGSIGSELCRQLARHRPARMVLLGHGEFSIFNIERELRRLAPNLPLDAVIADVRDGEHMRRIVAQYRPSAIFHAAAHKHVPLMETNTGEAFTNNVLGTRCVLRAAEECGVERFVLISTDKAVNPTSVMGATKRVAEMLVQETAARIGKPYVAVRFGNVLGSRGSAVPIFQEQIAAGGPVTITHPDMRRFFMTIPEAVQLVLQAAALGQGGEVFLLDMGELVRVEDLVKDLIELSGLTPGEDIEIVYSGIRPGEKLYEELLLRSEDYAPTPHEKVFVSRNETKHVPSREYLEERITAVERVTRTASDEEIVAHLCRLVPEFTPDAAHVTHRLGKLAMGESVSELPAKG